MTAYLLAPVIVVAVGCVALIVLGAMGGGER